MQKTFDDMTTDSDSEENTARGAALAKPSQDPRLAQLLEQHEAVLKRLGQKQRELERFNEESESVRLHLVEFLLPIETKGRSLDDNVHRLFGKILNTRKRSQRAIREIRELYWELQILGTISQRDSLDDSPFPVGMKTPFETFDPRSVNEPVFDETPPNIEEYTPDAHHGRADDKKDLRSLFLKLAAALHPDKVQDHQEKHRRTQLMKELNRAYQAGDLAKILEIEASLDIGSLESVGDNPEDEIDRRCRVLASQLELLTRQYHQILDDLLCARRSMLGEAVIEVRRNRRARASDPYQTIVEPMEESIEFLQDIHDHVESFAAGKTTLEEFLEGPIGDGDDDEECDCPNCIAMREAEFLDMVAMMGLGDFQTAQPKARSKPKAKKARQKQKAARKKNRKKK